MTLEEYRIQYETDTSTIKGILDRWEDMVPSEIYSAMNEALEKAWYFRFVLEKIQDSMP